jgi:YbbR domain-containing protein
MAFQLTGMRSGGEARGVAWRWLHALFLEDWTLKLLALLITLGLWYAVTTTSAPATIRLRGVQLDFILPENIEVGNEPLDEIDVTLEGSQGKLAEINARSLVARADLVSLKPGDRVVRLSDKNIKMDLPEGVHILEIAPRSLTVHLETVVEREVPVVARFEGELPEGFKRLGVEVTPATVRVRGPETHGQAVDKAFTETISLAGQRESIKLPQIAVDIPDHKVAPLEPNVSVRVEIAEEQSERRFASVPVLSAAGGMVSPSTTTVVLRGPRSIVGALRAEDVRVFLETAGDGSITPRLALPPTASGRVELVSTSPSEFSINK